VKSLPFVSMCEPKYFYMVFRHFQKKGLRFAKKILKNNLHILRLVGKLEL
jgi:hypothetical protein